MVVNMAQTCWWSPSQSNVDHSFWFKKIIVKGWMLSCLGGDWCYLVQPFSWRMVVCHKGHQCKNLLSKADVLYLIDCSNFLQYCQTRLAIFHFLNRPYFLHFAIRLLNTEWHISECLLFKQFYIHLYAFAW